MPVKIASVGSSRKVRVSTPSHVKARSTTPEKAARLRNLLNAVEHSDWRPSSDRGKKRAKQQKAASPKF